MAVSAVATDATPDYLTGNTRYANVESSVNNYRLIYDNEIFTTPFVENTGPLGPPIVPETIRIEIHGNVYFIDNDQDYRDRGAYDVRIHLWLQSGTGSLWHPINKSPEALQHVHHDDCDVNGNFDFEFEAHNLDGYKIVLLVEKSNHIVTITSGGGEYIINTGSAGEIMTFGLAEGVVLPLTFGTYHYYEDINIRINRLDGAIMRNAAIAREFIIERYGGTLPFNLPTIEVVRREISDAAARFWCRNPAPPVWNEYRYIEIDPQWTI